MKDFQIGYTMNFPTCVQDHGNTLTDIVFQHAELLTYTHVVITVYSVISCTLMFGINTHEVALKCSRTT